MKSDSTREIKETGPIGKYIRNLTSGLINCPSCGSENDFSQKKDYLNHFCCGCNKRLNDYWERFQLDNLSLGMCRNCNLLSFSGAKFCINCGLEYEEEPILYPMQDDTNENYIRYVEIIQDEKKTLIIPKYKSIFGSLSFIIGIISIIIYLIFILVTLFVTPYIFFDILFFLFLICGRLNQLALIFGIAARKEILGKIGSIINSVLYVGAIIGISILIYLLFDYISSLYI